MASVILHLRVESATDIGMFKIKLVYSAKDFEELGFHDCYVHGIRWDTSTYALILDLDYIVEWIKNKGKYEFLVASAELRFNDSSEVRLSFDWTNLAMECQIQDIHKRESRLSLNGSECYHWEIEFTTPHGSIELWSTNFELKIQKKPVLSKVQKLRSRV